MQAIRYKNFGGPEELFLTEMAKPIPNEDQFLVRVHAAGLNRADILQRRGNYHPPEHESHILGLEIAGEIVALGKPDPHFNEGDKIFGLVGSGAYAQYCLIDKGLAIHLPKQLSYIEGAGIAEAFITAQEALLTLGGLKANEPILIHAGASGVGSAAVQIARQFNAEIFTTISNEKKAAAAKQFGATHTINYLKEDVSQRILNLTQQQGVSLIIDFLGASLLEQHLQLLHPMGRLIAVGLMGGTKAEIDLGLVLRKRLQIKGLTMRSQPIAEKRIMTERFKRNWLPLFSDQKLLPVIDRVFAFADVIEAHKYMEQNLHIGKIILDLSADAH